MIAGRRLAGACGPLSAGCVGHAVATRTACPLFIGSPDVWLGIAVQILFLANRVAFVQTRNDRVHAGERFVKPRSEWIAADDRPNEVIRLERAPFGFAVGRSIEQRMPLPPRWPARKVNSLLERARI